MPESSEDIANCIKRAVFYGFIYFFLTVNAQVAEDPIAGAIEAVMEATPASELKRLRENLLSHYDKTWRPGKDTDTTTKVLVYFDARHIISLDEKYQTLTVEGIMMMKWQDERLKWDPSSYSGIDMLRIKLQDIWVPDIYSLFSVKKNDLYKDENVLPVQVYSNGTLKWYPQTVFDVPCSAKYKHYPFDNHNCSLVFGTWTHTGTDISLETLDISSARSAIGAEWLLTNLTHENELFVVDGQMVYNFVRVNFYLERTSAIYRYVCVLPTVIVFATSMAGFWLLPSDGSRYLIGCSNVVLMSLLLQYLAVTVHAGSEIPIIAQYSATCLCMSGVFLVITVITEIIRNCSGPPPNYLVRLAHQHMDQYLCLFSFSDSSTSRYRALGEVSDGSTEVFPDEEKKRREWRIVSLVVDRIAFWIFAFTYIVLLGVLASV